MAIFDALGQVLTNRVNQAMTPFTNPQGYMDSRLDQRFGDLYETEEERRRREEAERQQRLVAGPVAPAQAPTPGLTESEVTPGYQYQPTRSEPIKQTITFDPATGQQKMKLEGSVQDLSAANPLTPTVSMPSTPMAPGGMTGPTPEEIMRDEEQRRQYDLMMARPAGPVAPPTAQPPAAIAPEPMQMAAAPATTMTDVTAPTTGPMAAAPAAPAQAISPEELQRQMMQQDIQEGPVVRQAVAEGAGPISMNWFNIIQAAQNDPNAMERIARDPNTPEQWRRVAASQARITLEDQRKMQQAEARAQQIVQQGGRGLSRELRAPAEEGSYLKAYLFSRLGMNDLARAEQAKLTTSWQQVFDTEGNPALIQVSGTGRPLQGIDANGPIPEDQLIQYATGRGEGLRPVVGVGTVEKEIDGKMVRGRVVTAIQNGQTRTYVESGGKRYAYTGDWKDTGISAAAEKAVAQKQINLAYDPIIKAATTSAEELTKANIKFGTNFAVVGRDNNNQPIIIDQNTNQLVRPDAQGNISATSTIGTARGAGVPAGGTQALEIAGDIRRTAGQEAVKGVENFSQQTSDRAGTAAETAGVARRIRNSVDQNPQVVGLLTKRTDKGTVFDRVINAAVASIDAGLGGSDAIEQAAKQLNLSVPEQTIFEQVKGDLVELALARARENKGQGTFTDFERRLFASTTGDIARNQAAAIKYRMEIFEYAAEKAQRKTQFVEEYRLQNPNATVGRINNAFREYNKPFDEAFEKRLTDTYIRPKKEQVLR